MPSQASPRRARVSNSAGRVAQSRQAVVSPSSWPGPRPRLRCYYLRPSNVRTGSRLTACRRAPGCVCAASATVAPPASCSVRASARHRDTPAASTSPMLDLRIGHPALRRPRLRPGLLRFGSAPASSASAPARLRLRLGSHGLLRGRHRSDPVPSPRRADPAGRPPAWPVPRLAGVCWAAPSDFPRRSPFLAPARWIGRKGESEKRKRKRKKKERRKREEMERGTSI